ncbi:hypothetical protein DM01DRAFT_1148420 [Hesseltinella vesiculosa]|uniref:Polynucleotide 5'-hydroxyl-kinase GRC3 n=1 Tax=Hesseltinella vesiculosa TaxID=101127 RepID=A0A1X2G793_9FUNG|nr:hypothetical protein DM01DRAFT_1148420 [Hesseltinella vesiculosa]
MKRLVFVGQALIAPLFGTIDIMGALLSSEESMPSKWTDRLEPLVEFYPVFSSRATALTCVQSVPFQPSCTSSTLVDEYFLNVKGKLGPLQDDWAKYQSIIVVRSMHWNGVAKLEHCLPTMKDLFCVRSKEFHAANQGDFYDVIPGFQPIVTPTLEARCIQIEPSWEQGIGRLFDNELVRTTPPVSFVCGTKNMGKSTFARYLVNQLLNRHRRVAYLETDVGQSEFTPNGIVALHILDTPILGPPFTHPHHVARRAHFVGSTSSGRDPDHYMTCVQQLVEVWRQESDEWLAVAANENDSTSQQLLPLVVNTPGWTKGLGYDLLLGMMEHVAPSHVFAFSAPSLDHKFHEGRQLPPDFADHVRRMGIPQLLYLQTANLANHDTSQLAGRAAHRVPAPTTWMDRYQASDLRQLMTMSWIYMDPTAFGVPATAWWRPCSTLVERVPWKIDWTHLQGIWILFDDVPLSQLLYALNGSLVALIGQVTSDATSNDDDRTALTKKLPAYHSSMKSVPPDPYQTECLGLGLIRSIDREKRQLYLVTSLPLDRLRRVTRIVKGDLELALPMMLDHRSLNLKGVAGVSWRNVPYISLESIDGIGAGKVRARRNLMRRSQQH